MNTIVTTLTTEAVFSKDGIKRYLLRKTWDDAKKKLAVIMLAPSKASGIELDSSTLLVLNNVSRLGFGSVDILNLSAVLDDFALKESDVDDDKNLGAIVKSAESADVIVYAAGVGKVKNKVFQLLQKKVMEKLYPYEQKLHCLCNADGSSRLQHPLSPSVRVWYLSPLRVSELIDDVPVTKAKQKKKANFKQL